MGSVVAYIDIAVLAILDDEHLPIDRSGLFDTDLHPAPHLIAHAILHASTSETNPLTKYLTLKFGEHKVPGQLRVGLFEFIFDSN